MAWSGLVDASYMAEEKRMQKTKISVPPPRTQLPPRNSMAGRRQEQAPATASLRDTGELSGLPRPPPRITLHESFKPFLPCGERK